MNENVCRHVYECMCGMKGVPIDLINWMGIQRYPNLCSQRKVGGTWLIHFLRLGSSNELLPEEWRALNRECTLAGTAVSKFVFYT